MVSQQDDTAFPVQREAQWEAAALQALGQHSDVKRRREAGLTELTQVLQKEKFQGQFASLGILFAVTGRKRLK